MPDRRSLAVAVGQAITTAACAGLNLLTPLPPGTERTTLRYGPHPRHRLDLYRPARTAPGAGLVVFVYGGAWATGWRRDYRFAAARFLRMGWSVAVPDYRLLPEGVFPTFLEDAATAAALALGAGGADSGPLVLAGHSAGAYTAAMLALDPRYLRSAQADPKAVRAFAGLSGPYDFLPLKGAITERTFGHAADLAATQPITFARADAPAAFLATGDKDTTVYPRNTRKLAAALRDKGARVEERHYPGVDHAGAVLALSRPFRRKATLLTDMTAFLKDATA